MSAVAKPIYLPSDYQTKTSTTASLILASRVGFRKTLSDYFVKAGSSDFSDISIGAIAWNRIYDNLTQAVLVSDRSKKYREMGFISFLKSIIPDVDYPSATEVESLQISRNSAPTEITARFQATDQGDVTNRGAPGGSQASKQLMIINLNNGSAVGASGFFNFDTLDMPTGLNPFQDAQDVVAASRYVNQNTKLTLYAIAGDFPKATSSKATKVHLTQNKIELFTSDNQEGIPVDPDNGNDLAFSLSALSMYKLPTPQVLNAGDLISFKGEASYDGSHSLAANSQKLFLICIAETVGAGAGA